MVVLKIKSVQPKTGKTHRFFGSRYLKLHNMRDPNWTTKDKFAQYVGITQLHEKDQKLAVLARTAEMKRRVRLIKQLRMEVKDDRDALKSAVYGDSQRTKNILQNHKELQRLFHTMPNHMIIENMDHRTFVKRKELDRLICKRNQMTLKYQTQLTELSRMQDRVKYKDSFENEDAIYSRKIHMDLKNTETRIKAIRAINRAYQKIINSMMQDSLYFEPVLGALHEDIVEQQSFIETTIRLGRPALANVQRLIKEYQNLEDQTRRDMESRLETLKQYRSHIEQNNATIKNLVRRDSDFEIFSKRYERETVSMVNLKTDLENVEKVMKQLKSTTLCDRATHVYPRVKRQFEEGVQMEGRVVRKERERNAATEKDVHANVKRDALEHNLTDAEIERLNTMTNLRKEIRDEEKAQQQLTETIKERSVLLATLKSSFQHTLDVLRHVGDVHVARKTRYTNPDLNLPLLKFTAFAPRSHLPKPFEGDAGTIQLLLKSRVQTLMDVFDAECGAEELAHGTKVYHDAVLQDMQDEEYAASKATPVVLNRMTPEDPSVPTRQKLKASANRIVELNAKKED